MTVRRKCAYDWNTLPKYVYQDAQGNWDNFERKITTENDIINPVQYYNNINATAITPLDLDLYDICLFYVFANGKFHQYIENLQLDTFYYKSEYNIDDATEQIIDDLISKVFDESEYTKLFDDIQNEKSQFRSEYELEIKENEYINSFGTVPHSTFETESLVKEYQMEGILNTDIYSLFNQTELSEQFPLAITPRFYKVLKGYEYTLDVPDEECMYLFSYRGKIVVYLDKIQYTIQKEEQDVESDYIQEICDCINVSLEALTPMKEKFNGICMYPRQPLNMVIWRDLVMNNRFIAKHLVIDEHNLNNRIQKRKVFFMYYFDEDDSKTTMTMREDPDGVRLRILNGASPEHISNIINHVASSLAVYNGVGNKIAQDYNKLIKQDVVTFKAPEPTPTVDYNKPLKVIAPDMFPPKYSRRCQFLPRIIPQDEAEEVEKKEGYQVLQFPKVIDSANPLLFTCEQHRKRGYIYPGLRENTLSTKDAFPLLPCCYQEDQSQRKTLYKEYYDSDKSLQDFTKQPKKKLQYRFLISEKFVGLDQTGKCPEIIEHLFGLYTSEKPYRRGVHRSKWSALECVLVRLNVDGYNTKNSAMRRQQLESEFEKLKLLKLEICAQECWNIPNIAELLNTDVYFDLRFFIRLVEYAYQCRIIMISKTDFIHPNYIEGYIRWETNESHPIVILFEHMGSEADESSYPQCELIEIKSDDNTIYQSVYKDYATSLCTITQQPSTIDLDFFEAISADYTLTGQHIDFYGKVYAINVLRNSNNTSLTLFFIGTRVPPMHLDTTNEIYYVSSLPSNFLGNRYKLEIGKFNFYVYTKPLSQSKLMIYETYRLKSVIILENAKRIYANTGNFDFIQISPTAMNIKYSKYVFSDVTVIYVPSEEARDRLIYALKLFETRYRTQLELYRNDDQLMPFKYQSIQDFDTQSNVIIARVTDTVDWFSDFYTLKPIDGTLYTEPFMCQIQRSIYKCIPLSDIPVQWGAYKVLFPQIKRIFTVNCEQSKNILLIIQNTSNVRKYYKCTRLF